jgi:hypothetical protein
VSVYPQLEFAIGDAAERGLAEPGQTLVLPVLVSKEFHEFTVTANGAFTTTLHTDEPKHVLQSGVGVGRAFTRKIALMADVRADTNVNFSDDRRVLVEAGVIRGVRKVIVYGDIGHTLVSDDGGHTYLGVGIKMVLHERQ